jgi:hypothetical protein
MMETALAEDLRAISWGLALVSDRLATTHDLPCVVQLFETARDFAQTFAAKEKLVTCPDEKLAAEEVLQQLQALIARFNAADRLLRNPPAGFA